MFVAIYLLLLPAAFIFGQSVKVKKDLVLVNDNPVFQIVKVDESDYASWKVSSLDGELLISITGKRIGLPRLFYESTTIMYFYYRVDFHRSGKTGFKDYLRLDFRHSTAKTLIDEKVFEDGKYLTENEDGFIEKYCDFGERLVDLEKTVRRRDSLKTDTRYQNYLKDLEVRSAGIPVTVAADGNITVNQVAIGYYKMGQAKLGTTYQIYTKKGGHAGSIFHEAATNRVFIRTTVDNVGKEYYIEGFFDEKRLREAIIYLIDNAYL